MFQPVVTWIFGLRALELLLSSSHTFDMSLSSQEALGLPCLSSVYLLIFPFFLLSSLLSEIFFSDLMLRRCVLW